MSDATEQERAERIKELNAACRGLLDYFAHQRGCEIDWTDFCTCGMKAAKERFNVALKVALVTPKEQP